MKSATKAFALLAISSLMLLTLVACSGAPAAPAASTGAAGKEQPKEAPKDVIKLKIGHDQPDKHPYHLGAVFFAQKVTELTNGRVQGTVFPSAQLGNELTMLDSLRLGDLDLSVSAAPNASTHVPELGFFSVSYLFDSKDHFIKTMTDPGFLGTVQEKVAARNIGFRPIAFMTAGLRSIYNNQRPIKTVDDLKGLKMRVMASPIESRVWQTLGTLPTSIPFGEIYTAMQTGVINAAEGAPVSYVTSKHNEVAKYLSLSEHQWLVSVLWMSDKTWNKLPDDVKKAVTEAGQQMTKYEIELNAKADDDAVAEASAKNFQANKVEKDGFKQKLASLQKDVAGELGMEKALDIISSLGKK
ncbi:MAG: TRAP transporter substrate-binding protein [Sphingomonadaceae bacterium]